MPTVRQRRPRPSANLAVHAIDEAILSPRVLSAIPSVPRTSATPQRRDTHVQRLCGTIISWWIHDIRITAVAFQSASTTITGCRGTSIPAKLEGTTYPLHGIFRCAATPQLGLVGVHSIKTEPPCPAFGAPGGALNGATGGCDCPEILVLRDVAAAIESPQLLRWVYGDPRAGRASLPASADGDGAI